MVRSSSGNDAVEIDENLQPASAREQRLCLNPREVDEQEFLGKGKIFGQQSKAREAARRPRQQRLFRSEPHRLDRAGRDDYRRRVARAVGISHRNSVRAQQLVKRQRDVGGAAQKEAQAIDAELAKARVGRTAFEHDAEHRDRAARRADWLARRAAAPESRTLSISIGHSVSGQAVRKRQVSPLHRLGFQRDPAGQADRQREIGLRLELDDRGRRNRGKIMRVEDLRAERR